MDYFVYIHRRGTNGKIFYVGKGTRWRHNSKWGRTQHWHNIVKKHGYTIEIVQSGMQEWWAYELERDLILKYQDQGLCNRSEGGKGPEGSKRTPEQLEKILEHRNRPDIRKRISDKAKQRFSNPEYREAHKLRIKQIVNKPEFKQKVRQAALKQFSDPAAREKARQITLQQFADPKARENARIKALARFDSPEKRAKHAQAKSVRCINNGMVFGTTTLAAEWVASWRSGKSDNSQIAKACRGIIKNAYGLRWEYVKPATEVAASQSSGMLAPESAR